MVNGYCCRFEQNVYISDTNNHKIQKRTSDLQQIITEWGQYGSGNGEFNQPYGIAVDYKNDGRL